MQSIANIEEFASVENNKIIGTPIEMKNSTIDFFGENNILYIDEGVRLDSSSIRFLGSDNVVFISSSGIHTTRVKIDIYNKSAFYIGKNCNTTRPIRVIISERKHIIIGNDCLFSLGIWFRNSDPHLIYDCESKQRINPSKSVFVGDHVWIGQEAFISKGTKIGSGSIIGARCVTGGKAIPSNSSFAGVPGRVVKSGIFWDKPSVHTYLEEHSEKVEFYKSDAFIFTMDEKQASFDEIDKALDACLTSDEKLECLKQNLFNNEDKNRFFIPNIKKKTSLFKRIFSK